MKIARLPSSDGPPVEQPPPCESCGVKDAHIARLEARLNDPHWLAQRALALLSKMKGPALVGLAGAAVLLMLATSPLHGLLAGWIHSPSSAAVGSSPEIRAGSHPILVERRSPLSSTVVPSSARAVPPVSMPNTQAAPSILIVSKLEPSPLPISSPLPTCLGNHLPSGEICPPMGHRPKPSPIAPLL